MMGSMAEQLALDDAEDAALLARDEDAARIGRAVPTISLVDIGTLDGAAGELLCGIEDAAERVYRVSIPGRPLHRGVAYAAQLKE